MFRKKKIILAENHPATLDVLNNLGTNYDCQKNYIKAEALYKECLEKRKNIIGDLHMETFDCKYNLANNYTSQKKFVESEKLFKECIANSKLIGNNRNIFSSIQSLAISYRMQGKYNEAKILLEDL